MPFIQTPQQRMRQSLHLGSVIRIVGKQEVIGDGLPRALGTTPTLTSPLKEANAEYAMLQ